MQIIYQQLQELPPITVYEPEYVKPVPELRDTEDFTVDVQDDVYLVSAPWMDQLIADINFDDYESRMYFDRQLRRSGVFEKLEEMGIQKGDTVSICGFEFDYEP